MYKAVLATLLGVITILMISSQSFSGGEANASENATKIERLELRIDGLERRIQQLEKANYSLDAKPSGQSNAQKSAKPTGNSKDRSNWRQLEVGMSMSQVQELLGEPVKVEVSLYTITWLYSASTYDARVKFDKSNNKVDAWNEP